MFLAGAHFVLPCTQSPLGPGHPAPIWTFQKIEWGKIKWLTWSLEGSVAVKKMTKATEVADKDARMNDGECNDDGDGDSPRPLTSPHRPGAGVASQGSSPKQTTPLKRKFTAAKSKTSPKAGVAKNTSSLKAKSKGTAKAKGKVKAKAGKSCKFKGVEPFERMIGVGTAVQGQYCC